MKIMFSAGEASGDMHGANLARALKALDPDIELLGMGGSQMAQAGVRIVYDINNLGFIGVGEILRKIPFFFRLRTQLLQVMQEEKPDVLVCIDYPGFNMRLIEKARAAGIRVVYYILPTIWAWHKSRGKVIAEHTDLAISLFPFEAKLYEELGARVAYAGHPLLDVVHPELTKDEALQAFGLDAAKQTILLMPGSRLQEVRGLLPVMLAAVKEIMAQRDGVQFLIPRASTIDASVLQELIPADLENVHVASGHVYDMMNISTAAVAASGTATLETALMGLPTLLIYRVSSLTYWLSKILVHIQSIGLPNIIMGHRIMPELWQDEVTPEAIAADMVTLLTDKQAWQERHEAMLSVRKEMGEPGAVRRTAEIILQFAKENHSA
ncbi:lipid-A-disaccharide synthase [Megasphaera hominis]|jgi:lipid-A-disaccharide synthase|uniref:Lipid-A-disaccharide synthase n=1 Tax=Megasphaera hominis TaxID=159836 RepID=A0ABR6VF01_9FIRM|nr:lipid-A-disaccharide synthase [Megasphaera hominis]MBC3535832.1 lipid-A-disaccharide synthase [Megasphaera hominis]